MNRQKLFGLLVALAGGLYAFACFGAPPAREVQALRAVLEENFQATSQENLNRLMKTISSQAPNRAQFEREAQEVFDRTDVYVRLDEFEMVAWQPPYAAARVVQTTLPKEEDDRQEGNVYYATNSALLPEAETVEYTQIFLKERGKWMVHRIPSKPRPVGQNCPNGKCKAAGPSTGSVFK